jgi:hypothetical protein
VRDIKDIIISDIERQKKRSLAKSKWKFYENARPI